MGWLDLFRPKAEPHVVHAKKMHTMHHNVRDAFSVVHENMDVVQDNVGKLHTTMAMLHADMKQQKEWVKHLHDKHVGLHEKHSGHREGTKAELAKVQSWIDFLHKATKKQEKHLRQMQEQIMATTKGYDQHLEQIARALELVHKKAQERQRPQVIEKEVDYDEVTKRVLHALDVDFQGMQDKVRRDVHGTVMKAMHEKHAVHKEELQKLVQAVPERKAEPVRPLPPQPLVRPEPVQVASPTPEPRVLSGVPLTNPEQKLVNLLISEADPLSYSKISQLTGHSINTIRVNMNALKKKGLIEESTLPSGVKLFSVSNKEKIRKMYNVQVL